MWLGRFLLAGGLALATVSSTVAAQTATQIVTFRVVQLNHAAVATPVAPLVVRSTGASIGAGSYTVTTDGANQKIAVSLDRPMPAGMALAVRLAPPTGASSSGVTPVGVHATDAVTEIPAATSASLPMICTLTANPGTRSAGSERVVTYTVIAGA